MCATTVAVGRRLFRKANAKRKYEISVFVFRWFFVFFFCRKFARCVLGRANECNKDAPLKLGNAQHSIIRKYYTFLSEMVCRCKTIPVREVWAWGLLCTILFSWMLWLWLQPKNKNPLIFFVRSWTAFFSILIFLWARAIAHHTQCTDQYLSVRNGKI